MTIFMCVKLCASIVKKIYEFLGKMPWILSLNVDNNNFKTNRIIFFMQIKTITEKVEKSSKKEGKNKIK